MVGATAGMPTELSRMRTATTAPEANVRVAMIPIAHDKPRMSAMMPAESAPIA
jgi:hypothetical protein